MNTGVFAIKTRSHARGKRISGEVFRKFSFVGTRSAGQFLQTVEGVFGFVVLALTKKYYGTERQKSIDTEKRLQITSVRKIFFGNMLIKWPKHKNARLSTKNRFGC